MSFSGEMPPRMHELRMSFLWRIGAGDATKALRHEETRRFIANGLATNARIHE